MQAPEVSPAPQWASQGAQHEQTRQCVCCQLQSGLEAKEQQERTALDLTWQQVHVYASPPARVATQPPTEENSKL